MNEELKNILEDTIQATKPLSDEGSVADTKFLVTTLGIYRVSFTTLRDIYYLSEQENCGSSILDLTRKIIEYGISTEYMLLKGKEKMATRFQDYLTVQLHEEIEFMKSIGQDPATVSEDLKIGVDETEKQYAILSKKTKDDKTWAGRNFEGMLHDLKVAGKLDGFDSPRLLSAYVWGCRLNHPNPFVVRGYLEPKEYQSADNFYSRLGIVIALAVHLRIAARFIDESRLAVKHNIYEDVARNMELIQGRLDALK